MIVKGCINSGETN